MESYDNSRRLFVCRQCGTERKRSDRLALHLKWHEDHPGENYQARNNCKLCGRFNAVSWSENVNEAVWLKRHQIHWNFGLNYFFFEKHNWLVIDLENPNLVNSTKIIIVMSNNFTEWKFWVQNFITSAIEIELAKYVSWNESVSPFNFDLWKIFLQTHFMLKMHMTRMHSNLPKTFKCNHESGCGKVFRVSKNDQFH